MLFADIVLLIIIGFFYMKENHPDKLPSFLSSIGDKSSVTDTRSDRPDTSDFSDWFFGKAVVFGMPDGYENIDYCDECYGSWKAVFYIEKDNLKKEAMQFLNIDISENDDGSLEINCDWYYKYKVYKSKNEDQTSKSDTVLKAGWENGAIVVDQKGYNFTIPYFYRYNGREHALGSGTIDGEKVDIGLVRD